MNTYRILHTGRTLALAALMTLAGTTGFAQNQQPGKSKTGTAKPAPAKSAQGKPGQTKPKAPAKAQEKPQPQNPATAKPQNTPDPTAKLPADSNWWKNNKCIRKMPQATLKGENPNIVSKSFKLLYGRAMERAVLFSGDTLQIEHGGCDAYELTYTVKMSNAAQPPSNKAFWFERAGYLLVGLQTSDVPFDMHNAAATLIELSKDKTAQYEKDYILYKDENLEEKMNLVSVTTNGNKTFYSIRLTFKPIIKK